MVPWTPPLWRVTSALVAMLADATRHAVGDVDAPRDPDPVYPYAVVDRIEGGGSLGAGVNDPDRVVEVVYQVTSVGRTREQAEGLGDRVRAAILDRDDGGFVNDLPALPAVVIQRAPDLVGGIAAESDVFNNTDRYRFTVAVSHLPA